MSDYENSHDIILAKLEERFGQLLEVVTDIKNNLKTQTLKISELDREILTLKVESEQRQKDIDKLKKKHEDNRKWILSIIASIIGGVTLAVVKFLVGI